MGTQSALNVDINQTCFLCKRTQKITEEHVFPEWLLNQYNLRDQYIVLKNGTKCKYRNLRIPCCEMCNTTYLSQVENKISGFVKNEDLPGLLNNQDTVFIWLYKVMYGLHYKEMFLRDNIKDPNSNTIVSPNSFFERTSYSIFPLFARDEVAFDGFSPYSLFAFRISDSSQNIFYYVDEPYKMVASIIMGKIGIICSFQDDGYIKSDMEKRSGINNHTELTLPEFGDLAASVLHLKSRMHMLPNYLCHLKLGKLVFKIQSLNVNNGPLYSDFDPQQFENILTQAYRFCFEKLTIVDESGQSEIRYKSPFIHF